ncbi:MAG: hypothetical protein NTZ83_03270 [Candidatus Pacearchaeota archaeon]|nr:hypothetical protein [Candidatus Pacearchaeota archaeon]
MELHKKVAILGIAAGMALSGISYFCGRNSIIMPLRNKEAIFKAQQIEVEPVAVYDSKLGLFTSHGGGINENFFNSSPDKEYREPDFIDYCQRVDNQEHRIKFRALEKYEGAISEILTFKTAIENMNLINETDSYNLLSEKIISLYIKPGKVTEEGALPLKKLVEEGVLGDCNDVSASYYSLFNYYHIPCYLVSGGVRDNKEEGLHIWLRTSAKINGKEIEFELDPTWYGDFVPLDIRNETCEANGLKDEFIKEKK